MSRQFVRFVVVGCSCFVVVVLTFMALRLLLPRPAAAVCAYGLGAVLSYELSWSWTFRAGRRSGGQAVRFAVVTAAAMALNALGLQGLVGAGMDEVAAEILTLACLAPLTFAAQRAWSFRAEAS
jgi:putative flippase GtrA